MNILFNNNNVYFLYMESLYYGSPKRPCIVKKILLLSRDLLLCRDYEKIKSRSRERKVIMHRRLGLPYCTKPNILKYH